MQLQHLTCLPIKPECFKWISSFKWKSTSSWVNSYPLNCSAVMTVRDKITKHAHTRVWGGKLCKKHLINLLPFSSYREWQTFSCCHSSLPGVLTCQILKLHLNWGSAELSTFGVLVLQNATVWLDKLECFKRVTTQKKICCSHCSSKMVVTLAIASWSNCKNITACETQFQCFDLLLFQSFLFLESEINIPARRHTHLECWQCIVNAPNKWQAIVFLHCESKASFKPSGLNGSPSFCVPCTWRIYLQSHSTDSERGTNHSVVVSVHDTEFYCRNTCLWKCIFKHVDKHCKLLEIASFMGQVFNIWK